MNIFEILGLVLIHWIADYCFQTEEQGLGKSKSFSILFLHTFTYSLIFLWYMLILNISGVISIEFASVFFFITLFFHTLTDFFTSKLTGYYYHKKKMYGFPGFWTVIGFDQVFHLFQLFITYYLLKC